MFPPGMVPHDRLSSLFPVGPDPPDPFDLGQMPDVHFGNLLLLVENAGKLATFLIYLEAF